MDLNQVVVDLLIDTWIRYQKIALRTDRDNDFWAVMKLDELCRTEPRKALELVLQILKRDQSRAILEPLSAGPLEDILSQHGESMIEDIEAEAKHNASFAHLLGGVWQNQMSDEIFSRVQNVWDRKGWDGN